MNKLRRKVLESLPQELRDNVYAHLWEDTPLYYPILFEMSAETDRNRPNIELRPDFILGTDDTTIQFAAEAAAYFYSSLYVPDLDMPLYKSQDLTRFMQEDVFSVGLTPANFPLRSMIIRINLGDHDYTPGTKYGLRNARELKNVLKCLKDSQLRRDFKVGILLHSNRGPGDVDALWSLYQITHVLTSAIQVLSDQGVNVSIVYSAVRWSGGKMEHNFEATKITGISVEEWANMVRQVTSTDVSLPRTT